MCLRIHLLGLIWSGLTHEAVLISSCRFSNISIVLYWSSTYFKYTSIASTVLTDKRHIYVLNNTRFGFPFILLFSVSFLK
jgi:hypothetical protein